MELFLLFSIALTTVAFSSIVLAEPPSPLSQELELDFQVEMNKTFTNAHAETDFAGEANAVELQNEQKLSTSNLQVEKAMAIF